MPNTMSAGQMHNRVLLMEPTLMSSSNIVKLCALARTNCLILGTRSVPPRSIKDLAIIKGASIFWAAVGLHTIKARSSWIAVMLLQDGQVTSYLVRLYLIDFRHLLEYAFASILWYLQSTALSGGLFLVLNRQLIFCSTAPVV